MGTTIGPTYNLTQATQQTQAADTSSKKSGTMGKDEFLKLLVTQLQYQDPMKPMDDQQFIGQMAQFSALEQMQNLNTSFTVTKAMNLVGKYIEGKITKDGSSQQVIGDVVGIKMVAGKAYAVVNGQDVGVDDIDVIKDGIGTQKFIDLSKYTGLVGKEVKTIVKGMGDNEIYQVEGIVKAITVVQNGQEEVPVVVLNQVKGKVDSLLLESVDPLTGTVKEYLQSNVGKEVNMVLIDDKGRKTKIIGKVNSVSGDDNNPDVVLDGITTTVDSIFEVGDVNG